LLTGLGLRDRRVGILCSEPREFVVALAAAMLAGAVAVPLPATLSRRSAPRVRAILQKSRVAALIAPQATLGADWLFESGDSAGWVKIPAESLSSGDDEVALDSPPDTPLLVQFTSGSTGDPKGVVLSHRNVAANCAAIAETYGLDQESVGLSWLPLHHDMGLVGHVLTPMWVGGRSVLIDPLRFLQQPLRWLQAIGEEQATITSAPNFAYEVCTRAATSEAQLDLDLSSLTTAICGGEPVIPETLERFVEAFAPHGFRRQALAPSYGLAEATLLVCSGRAPDGPMAIEVANEGAPAGRRWIVLGAPVAGMKIRIVDPRDGCAKTEGIGEVEVSGTSVGRELDTAPAEWVKTGDLGLLSDGRLVIVGRIKELLILRGENVFPADVEAAVLEAEPLVVPGGVAAVGVDREGTQAMIVVAEVRASGAERASLDDLMRRIRKLVAAATGHVPDDVLLVKPGSLPRTTSGKLRRGEIAAMCERDRLQLKTWSMPTTSKVPLAHA
jgi:acyl-CoA synthetase (AMP-forming)/AMP-acid ligase II